MKGLRTGLAVLLWLCLSLTACGAGGSSRLPDGGGNPPPVVIPITGPDVPGAVAYDGAVMTLMKKWNIPAVSVAVTKNDKLILARGYGYADKDAKTQVQPDSLFRIASVSKPITAAAILHLVEQGRLALDSNFLDVVTQYRLPPGADPRLKTVTIRNLLQHSGGWDRDTTGYDPMFHSTEIASALGVQAPATCANVIRYMLGRPLDFDPGTIYHYSNFGYCVLGRVIEQVSGQTYETYVRENVLAPMGIHAMRIGSSLVSGRATGEVKYYDYTSAPSTASVFPGGGNVPWPDGGFYLEAMDAHGGWIASAIDLTRFMTALDGRRGPAFLSAGSILQMTARPNIPDWTTRSFWYGLGVLYRPQITGANWWHDGSLPGTGSLLVRSYNGYTWAILLNSRPQDANSFAADVDQAMWTALGSSLEGSSTDLYTQYPSPRVPASQSLARSN